MQKSAGNANVNSHMNLRALIRNSLQAYAEWAGSVSLVGNFNKRADVINGLILLHMTAMMHLCMQRYQ